MPTERKPEETKEEYHTRLKEEATVYQTKLKGKLVWNSTEQGTYVKPKDETPELKKPKLEFEAGGDPVYATGGSDEGDAYAGITDTEPTYFKSKPEKV